MSVNILHGDCRTVLPTLAAGSVQCCVTSPPYYGLRDYGVAGQIGLEPTPDEYVAEMVAVFREVRRVLRDDGTLWLNVGDSYAGPKAAGGAEKSGFNERYFGRPAATTDKQAETAATKPAFKTPPGYKPKDLLGIPWLLAFALRADGWYLRSDIIWHKPNPMPESVRDRPTSAHEHVFLLAKGQWRRRAVELSDLKGDRVHLGANISGSDPNAWATRISVGIATAILNSADIQQELGGISFEAQIRQERERASGSLPVGDLPAVHRVAAYAARLLNADASAKEFLTEVHRVGLVLGERNAFFIRGSNSKVSCSPRLNTYGEASIAIHDAGEIGEFDFVHGRIIAHNTTTCSYFYDAGAIAEAAEYPGDDRHNRTDTRKAIDAMCADGGSRARTGNPTGDTRNARNVWTIATQPYSGAHFATMPPDLAERCIKAGTKPGDTVLDPFGGAGTTGLVADRLNRNAVLIELNPEYRTLAQERIIDDAPLLAAIA